MDGGFIYGLGSAGFEELIVDESGKVIKSVRAVRAKMKIRTRVSDGEFGSTVSSA